MKTTRFAPPATDCLRFGEHGAPLLHLAHANGFPCGVYGKLLAHLGARYRVLAMTSRPLQPGTDPAALRGWHELAGDLRSWLRGSGHEGVIGVGHSLGAVTSLLASVEDPNLFRALVLIDPVLFEGGRRLLWSWMKRLGAADRLFLVRNARARRERWPSRAAVAQAYRDKALFAGWHPDCFEDYLTHGFVAEPDGQLRLRYPPAWEARIFERTPHAPWKYVRQCPVPTLVLRGAHSDALTAGAARRLARDLPLGEVRELADCGHLLPMERPDEVAEIILAWLDRLGL